MLPMSSPPPDSDSTPPDPPNAPPPDPPNGPPQEFSPPPPKSSPPPPIASPPPQSPPPVASPPPKSSPPPQPTGPPPPQGERTPPPSSPRPEPSSPPPPDPPENSSPPPSDDPLSSPPSSTSSPQSPPPPPPKPQKHRTPPHSMILRFSPPPPDPSEPPPPPLSSTPPQSSPPPPSSVPPQNSPSPPPPPVRSRSPPATPPSSNSPPQSPPPPTLQSPPPPPLSQPSPPSPSLLPTPPTRSPHSPSLVPPSTPRTNNSNANAPQNSISRDDGGLGTGDTLAIVGGLGFLVLGIFAFLACFIWKRKKKHSVHNGGHITPSPFGSSPESDSVRKVQISPNSRSWFTYEELNEATSGFSAQNLLGVGGFGSVHKGCLEDGREVAVKQLKIGGGQGDREFRSEVEIISRIHHRHLVSLVGYCIHESRRLLVYDYVPNNNLYFHLHGEGRPVMDWAKRVKIAVGAARGIAYLHEDCHPHIIHRDIKSSNILLDNNFDARVSDFGLAKLVMDVDTHITTRVMGTFGYMAPEYASSGKLTAKIDVYSYGVVLLELITGRKPVDNSQPLGEESLVEWARSLLNHALETQDFEQLADPSLERHYVDEEMFRMIEVAAACVRHSFPKRPKMGQVLRAFDCMATSDLTNGMKVGESQIFNGSQQSAEIRWFRRMAFGSQDNSTDFFGPNSWGSESNQLNSQRE